jgi:hypothetical protein
VKGISKKPQAAGEIENDLIANGLAQVVKAKEPI